MKILFNIAILCLLVVTSSCEETQRVIETAGRVQLDGTYTITKVNGNVDSGQTIQFNGLSKRVNGQAACNTYFADYTLNNFNLSIGSIAATKKSCPNLDDENALFEALNKVTTYSKADGILRLFAPDGQTILVEATY